MCPSTNKLMQQTKVQGPHRLRTAHGSKHTMQQPAPKIKELVSISFSRLQQWAEFKFIKWISKKFKQRTNHTPLALLEMERTWLPCQQNPTPSCGIVDTVLCWWGHTAPHCRWHQAVFLSLLWVTGSMQINRVYANSAKHRTWQTPPETVMLQKMPVPKGEGLALLPGSQIPQEFHKHAAKKLLLQPCRNSCMRLMVLPGPAQS